MRIAECGLWNFKAGVETHSYLSNPTLTFRIPHFAFRNSVS